jgi:hypothetical protein
MDGADISVYGEAKGEYTRQLCVFLVPCLESYFLELLEEAKGLAANPSKTLWHFQSLMQSIPDWNQDKVTKEKMLVRSEDEYTSIIQRIFKAGEDFIVITENSIYIISGNTVKKGINTPS